VTSQPDVECAVCERRLLRGEQPDVFVTAGRRRLVCELCAPRAAHEGWMRERDTPQTGPSPMRPRRGRTLIDRFRHRGRLDAASDGPGEEPGGPAGELGVRENGLAQGGAQAPMLAGTPEHQALLAGREEEERAEWAALEGGHAYVGAPAQEPPLEHDPDLIHAAAVFNASGFPRRVAGVARSLGAPEVCIRNLGHAEGKVQIVVAWELCWYRYEVELGDGIEDVRVADQGTELSELAQLDMRANAFAQDSGRLGLLAG
jgi:hypothetical protein